MPYIDHELRVLLNYSPHILNPGELNYKITELIISYVKEKELSYQVLNDVMGALAGAQTEFYRRVVVLYEDQKRLENGDVYTCLVNNRVEPL